MAEDEAWAGLPPAAEDDWMTDEPDNSALEGATDVMAPSNAGGIVQSDDDGEGVRSSAPQSSGSIHFAEEDATQTAAIGQSGNWVETLAPHNGEDGDIQAEWTLQVDSPHPGTDPNTDYVELSGDAPEGSPPGDENSINFANLEQIEW